jgi:hypothetical protein
VATLSRPKLGALAILAHTLIGFFFGVTAYFILDTFRLSYVVQTTPVPWLVTGVLGTLLYLSMNLVLSYAPPASPVDLTHTPRRPRRPRDFNNSGSRPTERNA